MLSKENNDLLCRVGPKTPMGDLLRQYWIPAMASDELPERDGRLMRVRLLGEDLIAFRDTFGKVGLLADKCSHRGASLFYARNEEGGLRCVYHGWKYDAAGRCVDMPNELSENKFQERIQHPAYPCREDRGIVWTYMGPRSDPPSLPQFLWTFLPEGRITRAQKVLRECNWMQALEGDLDSVHSTYLHSAIRLEEYEAGSADYYRRKARAAHLEARDTDVGIVYGARYEAEDKYYWRMTQYLMPFYTMIGGNLVEPATIGGKPVRGGREEGGRGVGGIRMWIPLDDENTMYWSISGRAQGTEEAGQRTNGDHRLSEDFLAPTADWLGKWRWKANKTNDYLIDYEEQRTRSFTGVSRFGGGAMLQDQAMTESMGPIVDRTVEHLGMTDTAIVRARGRLIQAAKALSESGAAPPGVDNPEGYQIRSAAMILPKDVPWFEAARTWLEAPPLDTLSEPLQGALGTR